MLGWLRRRARSRPLAVLDIGAGPGTWDRRIQEYLEAHAERAHITGIDPSQKLLAIARREWDRVKEARHCGLVDVTFSWGDLMRGLPYPDGTFDLTTCLYTVLNHIPRENLADVIGEMMRVTRGLHFSVVKPCAGTKTAYVAPLEQLKSAIQEGDWLIVTDHAGKCFRIRSTQFTAQSLRSLFQEYGSIVDLFGIDILPSKFGASRQCDSPFPGESEFLSQLADADEVIRREPSFANCASHIGVIVQA